MVQFFVKPLSTSIKEIMSMKIPSLAGNLFQFRELLFTAKLVEY